MKRLLIILAILAVIILVIMLGFQIKPRHFKALARPQPELKTMEIPQGLPKPVENFYRTLYGEKAPVIDSVVIIGHGRVRQFGIWLPTRFAILHNAGKDYRHYFEATFFGIPVKNQRGLYRWAESF